jgi:hypothetical protein
MASSSCQVCPGSGRILGQEGTCLQHCSLQTEGTKSYKPPSISSPLSFSHISDLFSTPAPRVNSRHISRSTVAIRIMLLCKGLRWKPVRVYPKPSVCHLAGSALLTRFGCREVLGFAEGLRDKLVNCQPGGCGFSEDAVFAATSRTPEGVINIPRAQRTGNYFRPSFLLRSCMVRSAMPLGSSGWWFASPASDRAPPGRLPETGRADLACRSTTALKGTTGMRLASGHVGARVRYRTLAVVIVADPSRHGGR